MLVMGLIWTAIQTTREGKYPGKYISSYRFGRNSTDPPEKLSPRVPSFKLISQSIVVIGKIMLIIPESGSRYRSEPK